MSNNANTVKIGSYHTSLGDYSIAETIDLGNVSLTSGTGYNWTVGAQGTSAYDVYTISQSNISPVVASSSGTMELRGENADIKVNGRSLMDAIAKLEERLNVLVPNPELETEWDELRELGERYRELEKKCKEKGEMWKKLKSMPPPEVK